MSSIHRTVKYWFPMSGTSDHHPAVSGPSSVTDGFRVVICHRWFQSRHLWQMVSGPSSVTDGFRVVICDRSFQSFPGASICVRCLMSVYRFDIFRLSAPFLQCVLTTLSMAMASSHTQNDDTLYAPTPEMYTGQIQTPGSYLEEERRRTSWLKRYRVMKTFIMVFIWFCMVGGFPGVFTDWLYVLMFCNQSVESIQGLLYSP